MRLLILIWVILFSLVAFAKDGYVIFLETNDIQSQLEPFKDKIDSNDIIVSGIAKVATIIKTEKEKNKNVIAISAGDDLMGPFYSFFKGKPEYEAMNKAGYDIVSFGNHEFDFGAKTYENALKYAKFKVLCTNIKKINRPLNKYIQKYTIVDINGLKVGFFGLITPDLSYISNAKNSIEVDKDLVKVSKETVKKLKSMGSDIVVAITHIGIENDITLAKQVKGIAAILGGHSHTLVKKPIIVKGVDGWKTVVVQAGARAVYVGKLYLPIKNDKIVPEKVSWNLILVDDKIKKDKAVESVIKPFIKELNTRLSKPIGKTLVDLDARDSVVRKKESNLGDFITDAMRWKFKTDMVFVNGGSIRGDTIYPKGEISYKTLYSIRPFHNTAVIMNLKGKDIIKLLEFSASALYGNDSKRKENRVSSGGFLQLSGLKVTYDLSKQPLTLSKDGKILQHGKRIKSVLVKTDKGFEPIKPDKTYKIVVNNWIAQGGDRYTLLKNRQQFDTTVTITDILYDYIKHLNGVISPKTDGRITVLK